MRKASAKVVNRLGLHARAAAKVVRLTSQFKSNISFADPARNVTADAKSLLSVLSLSASMGTVLTVDVVGEDEDAAVEAIVQLFSEGFGESQ